MPNFAQYVAYLPVSGTDVDLGALENKFYFNLFQKDATKKHENKRISD